MTPARCAGRRCGRRGCSANVRDESPWGGQSVRTVTKTRAGAVQGVDEGGVVVFRGIPYAEAPVGARRFRPAEPVRSWAREFDATRFGPVAPQPASPLAGADGAPALVEDEDC